MTNKRNPRNTHQVNKLNINVFAFDQVMLNVISVNARAPVSYITSIPFLIETSIMTLPF